jgi:transposase
MFRRSLPSDNLYSSRRIAQAFEERVDFMAVTAMKQPDFRTIAKFRQRHLRLSAPCLCKCSSCAGRLGW